MHYLILILLWIAWCTLHSTMISRFVTEALHRRLPRGFRYYRIFYNLVAAGTLLPVLLYAQNIRGEVLISWSGPWIFLPVLCGLAALLFFVAGARYYDLFQFLGLRQIKYDNTCAVLTDDCSLNTGGVLSMVRHPWYTGAILIVWARPLDLAALITNVVLVAYIIVGTILEERKLRLQFGESYREYQRQVSVYFPIKWIRGIAKRKR